MKDNEPTLGVHLLGTITTGMYSNPLDSIREYVQNGYDSIRTARREALLQPDEGTISISIDSDKNSLHILDNGMGLDPETAAVVLQDLGNSRKAESATGSGNNAGFRGIGRMAGMSYCDALRFETSDGKGKLTVVEFNAKKINQLTRAGQEPTTIAKAINDNCNIHDEIDNRKTHYTKVTLEGLKKDSPFLDREKLSAYLGKVAPVDYDPRDWRFIQKIRSIAKDAGGIESLSHIKLAIVGADGNILDDVRKPYKNKVPRTGNKTVSVNSIIPLPLMRGDSDGWWGWLAEHNWEGQLTDAGFAGLRIRMHNIAIGDHQIVRELFKTHNLSTWCFGEIYITDYKVTPNAQRNNFQESNEWDSIKEQISDDVKEITRKIRKASAERNARPSKMISQAHKRIREAKKEISTGIESRQAKNTLIEELKSQEKKIISTMNKRNRTEAEKRILQDANEALNETVEEIRSINRFRTDEAMAHLDKRTRRVVNRIYEVLKTELDEELFSEIQKKINNALKLGQ